jgi:AcrR family transcriptional regulator
MSTEPPADPYGPRRARAAARRAGTRARLLAAADELFRERGYPGASVAAIAERAGVSLQTLYLAWGNKAALLRAATAAAAVNSSTPGSHDEWRNAIRRRLASDVDAASDTAAYLRACCRLFVEVAERVAPYWRMGREAAVRDPEVAADLAVTEAERRRTMNDVAQAVPSHGLRPDIDAATVADTLWALASPAMHELLVHQRGYSAEAFEHWLAVTLTRALCPDGVPASGAGRRPSGDDE